MAEATNVTSMIDLNQEAIGVGDLATDQVHSRAYQIEMFESSMRQNIIVSMDTGSGKTQIARLRIEAALESAPEKHVWFCAPSVVLAQQQHAFLSGQLTAYSSRLITGLDNVQFWSGQEVWRAALTGIHIVVSTPQILLDALTHGFVGITRLSLLVLDEAHHCMANSPMAKIMRLFYHPNKALRGSSAVPHILGLTASPIQNSPSALIKLESNMDATCKTPTRHVDEYQQHVHLPELDRIAYDPNFAPPSPTLKQLTSAVNSLTMVEDPAIQWFTKDGSIRSQIKLETIYKRGDTAVMKEMRSFLGHVKEIEETLGSWAANVYVKRCLSKLDAAVDAREAIIATLAEDELRYMNAKLMPVYSASQSTDKISPESNDLAPKCKSLIEYLKKNHKQASSAIIFVKRRSTAFALTEVLHNCQQLQNCRVFSFVGMNHPLKNGLTDIADMQEQKNAFADFRSGRANVCVATQVMEEGVDVQAVNLVIRFDEPETFISFIQGRGRARRPNSRLALLHVRSESNTKLGVWEHLEKVMKAQYADERRTVEEMLNIEDVDEPSDDVYCIESTGAILTHDNARQHLDHFCSTLPRANKNQPEQAIVIISGRRGLNVSAQIRLPSSVAPSLQTSNSLRAWRSERAATKDASFQCYRKLHMAGVVSDNLVPFPSTIDQAKSLPSRERTLSVNQAIDPWTYSIDITTLPSNLNAHRIAVRSEARTFPTILCLTPEKLDHEVEFSLPSTPYGVLHITVNPLATALNQSTAQAIQANQVLLSTILGRRLKSTGYITSLPYLIVPDLSADLLQQWLQNATGSAIPLLQAADEQGNMKAGCLLRHKDEKVLYRWQPLSDHGGIESFDESTVILTHRLTKQLHFLDVNNQVWAEKPRELLASDCYLTRLPLVYGELMLFIPSISHVIGMVMRGQQALSRTEIQSIGFTGSHFVQQALIGRSASSANNYDRLEFLGDTFLKFYSSIQVFFDFPLLHESVLTYKRSCLVSNARLYKSALDLGLDSYITTEAFSGQDWDVVTKSNREPQREMSTKILADVVEALVGAAYLDGKAHGFEEQLVLKTLGLILPECEWKPPAERVTEIDRTDVSPEVHYERLKDVEQMIGYTFRHKWLLAEALTKTSLQPNTQSYQRLEFLGDAILDGVVNVTIFNNDHDGQKTADILSTVRHALASHHFLAFLAMCTHKVEKTHDIQCSFRGKPKIQDETRIKRLIDYVYNIPDKNQTEQREWAESTFTANHDSIRHALYHDTTFPWRLLHSIDTSKIYSDIIESILAATYIDSGADLAQCETVLEALGFMPILRRWSTMPMPSSSIETIPPLAVLRDKYRQLNFIINHKVHGSVSKRTKRWTTEIFVGTELWAKCTSDVSSVHADSLAAEHALEAAEQKQIYVNRHERDIKFKHEHEHEHEEGVERECEGGDEGEGDEIKHF